MSHRYRARGLLLLALLGTPAPAQEKGFQPERRVRESTRLDWEFVAGPKASVPASYDWNKQLYQLFVPPRYTESRAWPLVVFLSPGDDPIGWRAWRTPCEEAGWLFAAPYGAGNGCPDALRLRIVFDVLDD